VRPAVFCAEPGPPPQWMFSFSNPNEGWEWMKLATRHLAKAVAKSRPDLTALLVEISHSHLPQPGLPTSSTGRAALKKAAVMVDAFALGLNDGGDGESAESEGGGAVGKGVSRKKTQKKAEDYCRRHPYPGIQSLAREVGCSSSTMHKILKESAFLRARRAEAEAVKKAGGRAVSLTNWVEASTAQTREPNPAEAAAAAVDAASAILFAECKNAQQREQMRAALMLKTPEEIRTLADVLEATGG